MSNDKECFTESCTYNGCYGGYYGHHVCNGDSFKCSNCISRSFKPDEHELDEIYRKLDEVAYNALVVQDGYAQATIRELASIVRDLVGYIKEKENED